MELHPLTYDVATRTWSGALPDMDSERTLVLAIGAPAPAAMADLERAFPKGVVVGCGATNPSMTDLTVTVARFDGARLSTAVIPAMTDPRDGAEEILRVLAPHGAGDLRAILVLGADSGIEEVVTHLRTALPTLAIAGEQPDGYDAWVTARALPAEGRQAVVAVGISGESLVVPDPPESAPDLLLVTLGEDDPASDPDARLQIRTTTYDLRTRSWSDPLPVELDSPRTLVLVFGSPEFGENRAPLFELSVAFSRSRVLGCSGAGEIVGTEVRDGILSVAVARFVHTDVVLASADVRDPSDARDAGHRLAAALQRDDLRVVFVLSEGAKVDGAELVAGLCEALPPEVQITGGLAGDGSRFRKTWLFFDGELRGGRVVAAGLCGDHVVVGHGSRGGWDPFGPEHRVTKSRGNVVHELDGRPALDVYQEDLGAKASELPGSALPFPLAVRRPGATPEQDQVLFRTLLAVDEADRTLTFAGDVPEGTVATLMRAEWNRLVASAQDAAAATVSTPVDSDQLAIAVSGVGRRSVLGARTADEVGAVRGRLPHASIVGFYAYGELSASGAGRTELQNHTMTLTTLAESPVAVVGRVQADGNRPAHTPAPAPPLVPRALVVESFAHVPGMGWTRPTLPPLDSDRTLILAVGSADPTHSDLVRSLRRLYPRSHLVGWSAPGEQRLSVVLARFVRTQVVTARIPVEDLGRSYDAGRRLGSALQRQTGVSPVRLVLIAARTGEVRGLELVRGLHDVLGSSVPVLGGLAGADQGTPWVASGAEPIGGAVIAVGLCGDHLAVGHAVRGGIDPYPPERIVTRSAGTVLYELDGRPALSVFRSQLGPGMEGPPTGHWFGLWVVGTNATDRASEQARIDEAYRVVAVDEGSRSVTLDRPLPVEARVHLVRDTRVWLAAEARAAASAARQAVPPDLAPALALAVGGGLVGPDGRPARRELTAVAEVLEPGTPLLSWTTDQVVASAPDLGPDAPVAVLTLAESGAPLARPATESGRTGWANPDAAGSSPPGPHAGASPAGSRHPSESPSGPKPPEPASAARRPGERPRAADELTAEAPRKGFGGAAGATTPHGEAVPSFGASAAEPSPAGWKATPVSVSYTPTVPPPASLRGPVSTYPITRRADQRHVVLRGVGDKATPPGTSRAGDDVGVTKRSVGSVEVVTIGPRITESFRGEKLGRELSGTVILDLGRVERITSFGVREWLGMLRACRDAVNGLYLIRCTEPFVNQLTMIRGFAGHGQVVSFFAPYVCGECGAAYSALLDAERDRPDLLAMSAPKTFCPRCDSPGAFDDEEGSYFSVLNQLAETVPPDIRRVLSAVEPAVAADPVEKRVDGDVTKIMVQVPVDGALRWQQILDGVEGKLVLDFTRATGSTAEGAESLERALRKVGSDLHSVALVASPKWVSNRLLAASGLPRLDVWSLLVDAVCPTCDAPRTVLVPMAEHAHLLARGQDPKVTCPRCGTRLSFEPSRPLLRLAVLHGTPGEHTAEIARPTPVSLSALATQLLEEGRAPSPVPATPAPVSPVPTGQVRRVDLPPEVPRGLFTMAMVGGSSALFGVALTLLLVVLGFVGWSVWIAPHQLGRGPATEVGEVLPPVNALPPAWVEQPVSIDDQHVRVVGHASAAATEDAGMSRARDDALAVLVTQLLVDLVDSPVHRFVSDRVPSRLGTDDVSRVAKRYLQQMGARATPTRIDRFVRTTPYGVEVWGRYELPRATYDELLRHYGYTSEVLGARVAPFFPLLEATVRTSSEVVILSVDGNPAKKARVLAGELVRSVGDEPVHSVEGYERAAVEHWKRTRSGGKLVLELEANGATREVSLTKPAPR